MGLGLHRSRLDLIESSLFQLLIQRRKIDIEQFFPQFHRGSDFGLNIGRRGFDRGGRHGVRALDLIEQSRGRFQDEQRRRRAGTRMWRPKFFQCLRKCFQLLRNVRSLSRARFQFCQLLGDVAELLPDVALGRGRVLCADTTTANKREKSRLESGLVNPINAIERRAGCFS